MQLGTAIVIATGIVCAAGLIAFSIKIFLGEPRKLAETGMKVAGNAVETGISTAGGVATEAIQTSGKVVIELANVTEQIVKPMTVGVGKVFEAAADRLRTRTEQLEKLRVESNNLTIELERLRSQKINVNGAEMMFKWALATFELQHTDVCIKTLHAEAPAIGRNEKTEYLGVIRKDYQQSLGVDINKLEFGLKGNAIMVKGLSDVEVIGFKNPKTKTLIAEKRIFKWGSRLMPDSTEIIAAGGGEVSAQLCDIEDRMNQSQFAHSVNRMVAEGAQRMLQLIVGTRFTVKPDDNLENGLDFTDLVKKIATEQDAQATTIQANLQDNEHRTREIETDLRAEMRLTQGYAEEQIRGVFQPLQIK